RAFIERPSPLPRFASCAAAFGGNSVSGLDELGDACCAGDGGFGRRADRLWCHALYPCIRRGLELRHAQTAVVRCSRTKNISPRPIQRKTVSPSNPMR